MSKDFVVDISKLTQGVTQKGFGLPLILGTSKELPYALYGGISEVESAFGVESEEYKIASRIFGQTPSPQQIAIHSTVIDGIDKPTELLTVLNTLINTNNDWYFLTCTENEDDVITGLAGWIDTQVKTYFTTTQNIALLATLQSDNSVVMYHDDVNAYVGEGLVSVAATNDPGSITFKFKKVSGVLAANISATDLETLHTNGGFSYIEKMGVLQTTEGTTSSGEYIDVIMGEHWIKSQMEEGCMYLAINNKKISYDNTGISLLAGVAKDVLTRATERGIILRDSETEKGVFDIDITRREDTPKTDIANREYNGVKWTAELAGAIHDGTIQGYLTN